MSPILNLIKSREHRKKTTSTDNSASLQKSFWLFLCLTAVEKACVMHVLRHRGGGITVKSLGSRDRGLDTNLTWLPSDS